MVICQSFLARDRGDHHHHTPYSHTLKLIAGTDQHLIWRLKAETI